MDWRGDTGNPKPNSKSNTDLVSRKLTFSKKDINYIIVEHEKDIPLIIKWVLSASDIGGSSIRLSDEDKLYLINHITSFERIRRDY